MYALVVTLIMEEIKCYFHEMIFQKSNLSWTKKFEMSFNIYLSLMPFAIVFLTALAFLLLNCLTIIIFDLCWTLLIHQLSPYLSFFIYSFMKFGCRELK